MCRLRRAASAVRRRSRRRRRRSRAAWQSAAARPSSASRRLGNGGRPRHGARPPPAHPRRWRTPGSALDQGLALGSVYGLCRGLRWLLALVPPFPHRPGHLTITRIAIVGAIAVTSRSGERFFLSAQVRAWYPPGTISARP